MATVFRGPLISTPRRLPPAQDFQPQTSPAVLTPPAALPNRNYDFPLSARRDSARARDRDFVNDLPRRLEGVFPNWHQETPLATKALPRAVDSNYGPPERSLIQPTFRLADYPLPARKDSPRARDYLWVNDLPRRLEGVFPAWHPEWPTPARVRLDAVEFTAGPLPDSFIQPIFRLKDHPLPARRDSPRARDRGFVNDLPRRLEGVFPAWHPETPLAARRDSPRARDYWWNNDLPRRLEGPFPGQTWDWSRVAARRPAALDTPQPARSWQFNVPVQGQWDWPTATRLPRVARDAPFPNTTPYQIAPAQVPPFGQWDWSLPTRRRPGVADAIPPNTTPFQPVQQAPQFGQFDWPLLARIDSPQARAWFPVNPIPPEPTPPTDEGPNAWRRILQSQFYEGERLNPRLVGDLDKLTISRIIAEDDDEIWWIIDP
jgi:hypothetical protein